MIHATRRQMMAAGISGALAVPTLAGLAHWRWAHGEGAVLLFDPTLEAGRRFAEAGRAAGAEMVALGDDPVRLARKLVAGRPALIAGVGRQADALLLAEAAAELGYARVVALEGDAVRCRAADCRPGWGALGRIALGGGDWPEALANFAAHPGQAGPSPLPAPPISSDVHLAYGWLLAPAAARG